MSGNLHVSRRDRAGYAMVAVSYLAMGAIGALVRMAETPESMLIVLRMAIGALAVGALFARRRTLNELRQPGIAWRALLLGACSAAGLWTFFVALRLTDVSIGMFLLFIAPVYVALAAPRLFHQRTDRIVFPALAIALVGMTTILGPGLAGAGSTLSAAGVACGIASGIFYAAYMIGSKVLTRSLSSSTLSLSELVCDVVFLLPLALWQTVGQGRGISGRDLAVAAALGLVCTAFAYTLWFEGVRHVRVEHVSILGYLEPVSAPLYALVLLRETPAATTLAGGVLIVAAGVLIVRFGERDATPVAEPPPAS